MVIEAEDGGLRSEVTADEGRQPVEGAFAKIARTDPGIALRLSPQTSGIEGEELDAFLRMMGHALGQDAFQTWELFRRAFRDAAALRCHLADFARGSTFGLTPEEARNNAAIISSNEEAVKAFDLATKILASHRPASPRTPLTEPLPLFGWAQSTHLAKQGSAGRPQAQPEEAGSIAFPRDGRSSW